MEELLAVTQDTFQDIHQLLGLNILFWFIFSVTTTILLRHDIVWEEVKQLAPASWIAAIFGALFLALLPQKVLLGVVIIVVTYFLLAHFKLAPHAPKMLSYLGATFVGALSGFLQGGGVRGSDSRTAYLLSRGYTLAKTGAVASFVGIGNFFVGTVIFLLIGRLNITNRYSFTLALIVIALSLISSIIKYKAVYHPKVIKHTYFLATIVLVTILTILLWRFVTL